MELVKVSMSNGFGAIEDFELDKEQSEPGLESEFVKVKTQSGTCHKFKCLLHGDTWLVMGSSREGYI